MQRLIRSKVTGTAPSNTWRSTRSRSVTVRCALRVFSLHACWVWSLAVAATGVSISTQATNYPAQFELSTLASGDGSTGFVLKGSAEFDRAGLSVSAAGDVNSDGIDDLLIGVPGADPDHPPGAVGEVCVVFGSANGFPSDLNLQSFLADGGTNGFVISGTSIHVGVGESIGSAGDVNGDGIDDIILGAQFSSTDSAPFIGKTFVVFGRNTGFPSRVSLQDLENGDGSTGFVVIGSSEFDLSGFPVSTAGDLNNDGIDDLLIGAVSASPNGQNNAGESYVIFGRSTGFDAQFELSSLATSDGSEGFVLQGSNSDDSSGRYLGSVGDINGDGINDIAITAPSATSGPVPGPFLTGETYVVFGQDTGFPALFPLASLATGDGSTGFMINGAVLDAGKPGSVSGAGDVNGDGIDDLIIGSFGPANLPQQTDLRGKSYVVFGRTTGFASELLLSNIVLGNGTNGFVLNGINLPDSSGREVDGLGDINGDGIDDFIIGAPGAGPGGRLEAGESYVVLGRDSSFAPEFDLSTLATGDGSTGFVLNGINNADMSGFAVSSAGDINNDGVDDIVIGANGANPGGVTNAGEAYVVFGRLLDIDEDGAANISDNCILVANPDQRDTDTDGYGNRCDPDLNNDGIINFVDVSQWTELFNTINNGEEDFNGDGLVNFGDFSIILEYIFSEPGPSALAE